MLSTDSLSSAQGLESTRFCDQEHPCFVWLLYGIYPIGIRQRSVRIFLGSFFRPVSLLAHYPPALVSPPRRAVFLAPTQTSGDRSYPAPPMPLPPSIPRACPSCGSTDRYLTKVSTGGGYAPNYLPQLSTKWWTTPRFDVVVCAKCGLTQFFAPPENRAKLPTSKGWTRL